MDEWLSRTSLLIGEHGLQRLAEARVALLGLGGVGGACAEALCRAGIGNLLLVDNDTVEETNLNRQLFATRSTLGLYKTQAAALRLQDISPTIKLTLEQQFFLPENAAFLFDYQPDLILDAIDTVTAKLYLAQECTKLALPLVSCLGTGNRLFPERMSVGDLSETRGFGCPLARIMRRELRKRGIEQLRVVYSVEPPAKTIVSDAASGRHAPGSISFVPPVAGYLLAAEGIHLLLGLSEDTQP